MRVPKPTVAALVVVTFLAILIGGSWWARKDIVGFRPYGALSYTETGPMHVIKEKGVHLVPALHKAHPVHHSWVEEQEAGKSTKEPSHDR